MKKRGVIEPEILIAIVLSVIFLIIAILVLTRKGII